jgi:hypothetical protein
LKKQSQFGGKPIGVKSYMKGYYVNILACRQRKNKANSNPICWIGRRMDSRLHGNDKQISVLIGVNPCLNGMLFEKTNPMLNWAKY